MSAAERTNDSATKSPPSSAASARSSRSLSVIAGSSGRAYVTLMPLRADSGPGDTAAATTTSPSSHWTAKRVHPAPLDGEPRHAVADDDLRALRDERGELVELDRDHAVAHAFSGRRGGAEAHDVPGGDGVRHRVGREAQLGPLEVEQQPERAPGALPRFAYRLRAPAQVLVGAVRAVQACAVNARQDHLVEDPVAVGGRAERRHDLRSPAQHARECCTTAPDVRLGPVSTRATAASR